MVGSAGAEGVLVVSVIGSSLNGFALPAIITNLDHGQAQRTPFELFLKLNLQRRRELLPFIKGRGFEL